MLANMWSSLGIVLFGLVGLQIFHIYNSLRKNIARARKTGLNYVVVPGTNNVLYWQVCWRVAVPLIKLLPKKWWEDWITFAETDHAYRDGQVSYEKYGNTFLIVSPFLIEMYTQEAAVINQIIARREDFPKPHELYEILDIFGKSVVSTEGATWKMHRKATSPSFNEKNAAITFREAIYQTKHLIAKWLGPDGKGNRTLGFINHDTMTWALNIIGFVGFGLRFTWPGQPTPDDIDPRLRKYVELTGDRTMTFPQSLEAVLDSLLWLLITPDWLMRFLPLKSAQRAAEAANNYRGYMKDFLADKKAEVRRGDREHGMDLMGQLVRGSMRADASDKKEDIPRLSDSDVLGNAFLIIVAGHETTANTFQFTLLELATNPAAQRALQKDIDRLFGRDSDPETWDFESNISAMTGSMLGATMNEAMRMMPSVVVIPKRVSPHQDQTLNIEGKPTVLPAGLTLAIATVSVQRNPAYWPTKPSKSTGAATDLDDFLPERWFRASGTTTSEDEDDIPEHEDVGGPEGPDVHAELFRPVRGSYIPFSDGARSCLGRRIAVVEVLSGLAVIFQRYSLELAVDEWASDEEIDKMGKVGRARVYAMAQEKSRKTLKQAATFITLKFVGDAHVPVRLVPRGEERFVDFVDP